MRYKVPQNVQREDQIIWFITLRQLIILMIGGGISYVLYVTLKKEFELSVLENILIFIPAAIAVAIAFLRIKGMSLLEFVLHAIEQALFRPGRRFWIAGIGEPKISSTFTVIAKNKKQKDLPKKAQKSRNQIKNLANLLDRNKQ